MVSCGKDRLQLRLKHMVFVAAGAIGGICLPAGAVGGEAGRLLTTFMGFFTAGVLPTISILIGTISAAGRSVKALNDVYEETKTAISALISLLKLAGTTVAVLFLLNIPKAPLLLPVPAMDDVKWVAYLPAVSVSPLGSTLDLVELALRMGQGLVCCLAVMFVFKAASLPHSLYAALQSKHGLAVDEARRVLEEKAPKAADIKKAYGGGAEFGTVVRLDEKAP